MFIFAAHGRNSLNLYFNLYLQSGYEINIRYGSLHWCVTLVTSKTACFLLDAQNSLLDFVVTILSSTVNQAELIGVILFQPSQHRKYYLLFFPRFIIMGTIDTDISH